MVIDQVQRTWSCGGSWKCSIHGRTGACSAFTLPVTLKRIEGALVTARLWAFSALIKLSGSS